MKITDLLEKATRRNEKLRVQQAPSTDVDGYYTTVQAAKVLGVSSRRVRQYIEDGELESKSPKIGRRDHLVKKSAVSKIKGSPPKRTGRPDEGKGTSTSDKGK